MLKVIKILFSSLLILFPTYVFAQSNVTDETDSPYRKAGNFIFISAQPPIDTITHRASPDVQEQVKQVFYNLREQVVAAGATMNDVIKLNVYMDDIDNVFPVVKKYIPSYFAKPYPARTPLSGLQFGASGFKVVVDAVVYVDSDN